MSNSAENKRKRRLFIGLLVVAVLCVMSIYVNVAAADDPPWDPTTQQVNIGGATLFESFFQGPGSTNDYIDVNDNGLYGYNAGVPPYVDQLAKDWTNFNSAPPSTHWIVNYRGIGSGGGLGELLTFQAVQVATNQTWFPIGTWNSQGGSTKGGRNYGILPVTVTAGLGLTNRTAYSDEGSTLWGGPYANTSGIPVNSQGIDIGVMDVPTKWFVKAGSDNQAAWSRKPTAGGYGRYAVKSWDTGYKNTLKSLSITLTENPDGSGGSETVTLNTNTAARNSTDIAKMMECINSGDILQWAADQTGGGNIGTVVMPHIIGDFNADGNFDAADVRYFADGLAVGSNLNRTAAFEAVDNATGSGGNFFGTILGDGIHATYNAGDSRADLAGSDPAAVLLGATPGAATNGADGVINGYDISYLQRVLNGWLGAKDLGITDTTADGTAGWDWDNLNEAVFTDLSCDLDGNRIVNQADVDLLVGTILETNHGDANLDTSVDVADLGILAGSYGTMTGLVCWGQGDFSGDGNVDVADLGILAGNYGTGEGTVPEPMTVTLLVLGLAGIVARRRRAASFRKER